MSRIRLHQSGRYAGVRALCHYSFAPQIARTLKFAKKIQDILYSVAEGFEVPQEANQENHMPGGAVEVTY